YECIPLMALRALPEQFSAPVAAVRADMGVEIEDCVTRQPDVAADQIGVEPELEQRPHDLLMDDQTVRVVGQRGEQQVEGVTGSAGGRVVTGEGQPGAPVLGILCNE